MMLLWGLVMLLLGVIVWNTMRTMEKDASNAGAPIDIHEATRVTAISCRTALTAQEAAARLAEGVPAGELISTWDAEQAAYCFRSELPDGSAPMYFSVEFAQTAEGTKLTLTRQRTLLHGRRDCVMWLPGYLAAKLGATDFHWTLDGGAAYRGRTP